MRIFPFALIALLSLAAPATVQAQTKADDITEVVVRGRKLDWSDLAARHAKVPGPAVWRLSRGASTVWVTAVLEEAPAGQQWDQRFLKSQLADSRLVLLPGRTHYSDSAEKAYRKATTLTPPQSLKDVVSGSTYDRFTAAVAHEGFPLENYTGFTAGRAGAEMYDGTLAKMGVNGDLGQVAEIRVMAEDGRARVKEAFRFDGDVTDAERLRLSPAQNEACLNAYLDGLDYDRNTLPRLATAWAAGDLDTMLRLYRDPPALTCDLMTPDWAGYETAAIGDTVTAIDEALKQPGKSVAVVTLSHLLRKNGVLEQLHARGVTVGGE